MVWETRQLTHGEAVGLSSLLSCLQQYQAMSWPSAGAWGGFGEEGKLYSHASPVPAPPCDVIAAVFVSDSPWWLFLLCSPLTSWTKPMSFSTRDLCALRDGWVQSERQPAAVWDRISEGLPAARCLGSTPALQSWKIARLSLASGLSCFFYCWSNSMKHLNSFRMQSHTLFCLHLFKIKLLEYKGILWILLAFMCTGIWCLNKKIQNNSLLYQIPCSHS